MAKLLPSNPSAEELTTEQLLERKTQQVAEAERALVTAAVLRNAAVAKVTAAQIAWRTENAALIDAAEQAKAAYNVAEMELAALGAESIPTPDQSTPTATFRSAVREAFTLLQFKAKSTRKLTQTGPAIVDWAKKFVPFMVRETVDEKALLDVIAAMPPEARPPFYVAEDTLEAQFRRKDIEAQVALEEGRDAEANAAPF